MEPTDVPCSTVLPIEQEPLPTFALVKGGQDEKTKRLSFKIFSCLPNPIFPSSPEYDEKKTHCQHLDSNGLSELKKKGYLELSKHLENKCFGPLDNILQLNNPLLVEQLIDLCEILELKEELLEKKITTDIINFALTLSKSNNEKKNAILGKLIFLLSDDLPIKIENIDKLFSDKLEEVRSKLDLCYKMHKKTGLQNGEVAKKTLLSVEIARMLVSVTGRINVGIIDEIISYFIERPQSPMNYEINLLYALNEFKIKPELREQLLEITPPSFSTAPANVIIRSTLKIPSDQKIDHIDAKKTALAACLSHLRQGKDGSCFATPLSICLMTRKLDYCLKDFQSLLHLNRLVRRIKKSSHNFPILLCMGERQCNKEIKINRVGNLIQDNSIHGHISESPGIITAAYAIGIKDPKKVLMGIIQDIFKNEKQDTLTFTIKTLLDKLTKYYLLKEPNANAALLYINACFALEAEVNSPLLNIWENSIASMAEADEDSMIHSAVTTAIMNTIKRKIRKLYPKKNDFQKQISKSFRVELKKRIHLQYDPHIKNDSQATDQRSTGGAFVLYDINNLPRPSTWIRIDNPTDFQKMLLRTIKDVKFNLTEKQKQCVEIRQALESITNYFGSLEFICSCLKQYYKKNSDIENPMINFERIKYSPWVTKSGNSFSRVVKIYSENINTIPMEQLFFTNPKSLLLKIMQICRENRDRYHLFPVRIPGIHAFSLFFGHPQMIKNRVIEEDLNSWIENNIISTGKQVADSKIDITTRTKIIERVLDNFIKTDSEFFKTHFSKIKKDITIRQVRNEILKILQKKPSALNTRLDEIIPQIDTELYQLLPQEKKEIIISTCLPFADSNWVDGICDIYLCFVINPGNGDLEIWGMYDDDTDKLFAMDQTIFINDRGWEFFSDFLSKSGSLVELPDS